MFGGGFGSSNNVFASKQNQSATVKKDGQDDVTVSNQIINTVKQDMEAWAKSGQWIFSCYSCAKDCASLPGLQDLSPEELRYEAYENVKSGSTAYQSKLTQLAQEYKSKRSLLENPDPQLRAVLLKIYYKEPFGDYVLGSGPTSIFGSSTPSQSVFGSQQNTGIFGGGGGANKQLFGGGQQQQPQNSIFGGAPTFGGAPAGGAAPQTNSIFGGQQSTFGSANKGLFGGGSTTNTTGGGIFGGGASQQPAAAATGGIFGGGGTSAAVGSSAGGIFGGGGGSSNVGGGVFGNSATTAANNTGLFGSSSNTTGADLFGRSSSTISSVSSGASIFGATTPAATTSSGDLFKQAPTESEKIFGQTSTATSQGLFGIKDEELDDSCVYSVMSQLTPAEIQAYESASFQLGHIPLNPPPQELCKPVQ